MCVVCIHNAAVTSCSSATEHKAAQTKFSHTTTCIGTRVCMLQQLSNCSLNTLVMIGLLGLLLRFLE